MTVIMPANGPANTSRRLAKPSRIDSAARPMASAIFRKAGTNGAAALATRPKLSRSLGFKAIKTPIPATTGFKPPASPLKGVIIRRLLPANVVKAVAAAISIGVNLLTDSPKPSTSNFAVLKFLTNLAKLSIPAVKGAKSVCIAIVNCVMTGYKAPPSRINLETLENRS